ncbi:precorrin-2 dehydrogenase/sirohydrochlorin ferrochelatase family protein [Phycicoccus flavus]|uniref:precorrin-2 dehydrogenase n=1 Tax=Phycicoccus flavus TaxID=2502783 RepID=A0A8T6R320_9MICO|nr:NAD(P)-dependent oxidoreductase [Phycicoccus flavus]NHA68172.1 NAD(P)-dependent oxidoreductase [Phycicoccus flavus]
MPPTTAGRRIARDRTRLLAFPREGRRAVVVGGGPVAARRAAALTQARTPVAVFAPRLCDDVFDLLAEHLVTWEDRWPTLEDLHDAWLVHAATGDAAVDARICSLAATLRSRTA